MSGSANPADQPPLAVLLPLLRPIAFVTPERVTAVSAWKEHVPFALDLVALLRPRTIVELGTHAGDSYCAMCQAVVHERLETRCYAVDTWEGDEHSGRYGPEVLADLRDHHDPRYGGFSRLVQATFDAARGQFADGSIDLLHVDGFHTYDAVKADVEGWLPKLGPAGVILLHDTNVRERGFGVWRVWEELAARYPHFEFLHGHGLGIAAVGATPPPALAPLFAAARRDEDAAAVRSFFFGLGQRVRAMSELGERTGELAASEVRVGELEGLVQQLQDRLAGATLAAAAIDASRAAK